MADALNRRLHDTLTVPGPRRHRRPATSRSELADHRDE